MYILKIKTEKGITGIDIIISVIIITIFVTIIGNLVINININSKSAERKAIATSYTVSEIENIKAQGYLPIYDDKGIYNIEEIEEKNEEISENGIFTGYSKKVKIEDYVLAYSNKQKNLLKKIIVEISYKLGKEEKTVALSTVVVKE